MEKIKSFIKELIDRISNDQVMQLGAQSAYYFIVSIAPLIILFINIASFFAAANVDLVDELIKFMPDETFSQVKQMIGYMIRNRPDNIISTLIAIITAVWSSSKATNSLLQAINTAYQVKDPGSGIKMRAKAMAFTLLFIFTIIVVLLFMIYGGVIQDLITKIFNLNLPKSAETILLVVRLMLPVIIMILSLTLFYKFGPNFHKNNAISWKMAFATGLIASIGWIALSLGYSFYMKYFSKMPLQYGPVYTVFALVLWLFLTSLVITISAELVSVYMSQKQEKAIRSTFYENA